MTRLPLRRSPEYKSRVTAYSRGLAKRYRTEIAEVFLASVQQAEQQIHDNHAIGTDAPYLLAGQHIVLKELYFKSGPVDYCLIYELMADCVGLVTLWHGVGQRGSDELLRIWRRSDQLFEE